MVLIATGMEMRRIAVNPEIAAMDARMLVSASIFSDTFFVRMFASQRLEKVMARPDAKGENDN